MACRDEILKTLPLGVAGQQEKTSLQQNIAKSMHAIRERAGEQDQSLHGYFVSILAVPSGNKRGNAMILKECLFPHASKRTRSSFACNGLGKGQANPMVQLKKLPLSLIHI